MKNNTLEPQYLTIGGKRVVVLDEAEFDRLVQKADEWEPALPEPDGDGHCPALQATSVILARKILRHRRGLGLSQAELARRAGIKPAVLSRIERGHPDVRSGVIAKIESALQRAERDRNGKKRSVAK